MNIIERNVNVTSKIKPDAHVKIQFSINSDNHFCIRCYAQEGDDTLIVLTSDETNKLARFVHRYMSEDKLPF